VGEARDLGDLDTQTLERRRGAAGAERRERPELAGLLVVPEDGAAVDADESRRNAHDGRQEFFRVRQVAGHLGDAEERREDLLFVDLVSNRQRAAMRADAIRKFAARYQVGVGLETPLTSALVSSAVEPARAFLAVLGLAFAVAGVVVAWTVDKFTGLAVLVIGAFLLFLPFMRSLGDE